MSAKKKKKRQSTLRLTDKRHPVSGVIAAGLGMLSVGMFLCLCFVSSQSHGNAGLLIGLAGILCFLISVTGFVMAWITLHRENIRPVFPTIAAVVCGLSIVFYLVLYVLGNMI